MKRKEKDERTSALEKKRREVEGNLKGRAVQGTRRRPPRGLLSGDCRAAGLRGRRTHADAGGRGNGAIGRGRWRQQGRGCFGVGGRQVAAVVCRAVGIDGGKPEMRVAPVSAKEGNEF